MRLRALRSGAAAGVLLATVGASACGGGGDQLHGKSSTDLTATVRDAASTSGQRCAAASELGKRKATDAGPALTAVLRTYGQPAAETFTEAQWQVASCVARALGRIGDPRAVQPILQAWWVATPGAKVTAASESFADQGADLLAAIGTPAVPQLVSIVTRTNTRGYGSAKDAVFAYSGAIVVLGRIGDRRAEAALVGALRAGHEYSEPAVALALLYRRDAQHLVPLLRSKDTVNIAYGLVRLGAPGTETALRDGLLRFGDEELAKEYLNCGNATLEAAAETWATKHGYQVNRMRGQAQHSWGSLR